MNGQQQSSSQQQPGLLSVPGSYSSDLRRPQARRSSAVAIVLTRGESITLHHGTAAAKSIRIKRPRRFSTFQVLSIICLNYFSIVECTSI